MAIFEVCGNCSFSLCQNGVICSYLHIYTVMRKWIQGADNQCQVTISKVGWGGGTARSVGGGGVGEAIFSAV